MAKDKERWSSSLHSKKAIKDFLSNIENGEALYEDALAWEKSRITNINEHIDIRVGKKSPFPSWDPTHPERYDTPITIFDAEVGGWSKRTEDREVIALGALKVARNKLTKTFETVDVYERYYTPTDVTSKEWREAHNVHELTPGKIQKLRSAQKKQGVKSYSNFYDADEEIAFRKFIEGSILSGHNILKADIPWVFSENIPGISTIDTLVAMQNMRGLGGNSLDQVFKDMFGKSMEAAGFGHHGALDDAYAEAMVLEKLIGMKNATGKSIQWILDRAQNAPYHLSPTDNPDIHGPSQLTYGPLYGYLKDVNYYISRRALHMKPLDERYDIVDPETGGLKDGFYVEDVLGEDDAFSPKKKKSYAEQFASVSLLQEIKEISKILHQEIKDFSGDVKLQGMSVRPAQLRYLSKLVGEDSVTIPQSWKDAADVLGVPHSQQSRYYKASFDLARLTMTEKERERKHMIDYWKDKIPEIIKPGENIDKAIDNAIEKTEKWTSAIAKFSQIPVFDPGRLITASEQGMNHALSASRGIIPSIFTSPLSRYADLIQQKRRYDYAPFQATDNIIKASGLTLPGIGATIGTLIAPGIGTVVGGAIGGGIKGAAGLTTQIWGNAKEASIKRKWGNVSMGLDVLGIGIDFVTLPFKMLATATKLLYNSFTSLGGLLKSFMVSSLGNMGDLGNPLTIMTGVTYRDYQGLEIAEGMLGLGKGSLNKSYESHAQQIHMLYSQGSYNEGRLKAASMLGIFDEVYGVQGSYDKMINTLAKRDLTATDMALLSTVDSQAPQILQVMKDIGATSLEQLGDPSRRDIYFNKINNGRKIWDSASGRYVDERTAFRQDYYEYEAIKDSFGNSARRIGDTVWRNGGRTFANTLNTAVGYIAEGRSWDDIKPLFEDLFSNNEGDTWLKPLQEAWEDIKQFLKSNWSTVQSSLLSIIDTFIDKWLATSDKLAKLVSEPIAKFLNTLMNMRIEGDLFKGFHLEIGNPKEAHANITFMRSPNTPDIIDGTMLGIMTYKESMEKKLARLRQNQKNGSRVFHGGTEVTYEEAENIIRGIKTFITPEAIYNTIHEGIEGIRQVKDKVLEDAPDVLRIVGESVGSLIKESAQEMVTTVKIVISDDKGNTREINMPGEQVYFGNVSATMLSAESRGGR